MTAQSSLHGVESTVDGLEGSLSVDIGNVEATAAGLVSVPLGRMRFGDRIKEWVFRRHLNVKRWPDAAFEVTGVRVLEQEPWRALIEGALTYRGREHFLSIEATGMLTESGIDAQACFELSLTDLGVEPPRFLILSVSDIVRLNVRLYAGAVGC